MDCHSLPSGAGGEIAKQREIERLRRVEEPVVDVGSAQLAIVARCQVLERLQIRWPNRRRLRRHFCQTLDVLESRRAVEWKCQLVRIEHLKDDDVIAARLEMSQALDDRF